MKNYVLMTFVLMVVGLPIVAQESEYLERTFDMNGRALTVCRSKDFMPSELKANAQAMKWILTGKGDTVTFCLKNAKSNDIIDSLSWQGAHVEKRINKGKLIYTICDTDSMYLNMLCIGGDVYAIQIYSQLKIFNDDVDGIETVDSVYLRADPMTGRRGGKRIVSKHFQIEIYDNGEMKWWLKNPPHIFVGDILGITGQRTTTCNTKVGLYKSDGTLIALAEKWKGIPSEHGQLMSMYAQAKMKTSMGEQITPTIYDLLTVMKTSKGAYLRVVTPVYGDYLMDVSFKFPSSWYVK